MNAYETGLTTDDGLKVYDLTPQSGDLVAVAGPSGVDPSTIDPDALPNGFRWVQYSEWAELVTRCGINN